MCDFRLPDDTLFILSEGDFRFRPEDCVAGENWLVDAEGYVGVPSRMASSRAKGTVREGTAGEGSLVLQEFSSDEEIQVHPHLERSAGTRFDRKGYGPWQRPEDPAEIGGYVSPELRDIVRTCTQAHRIGRGKLVWFSWEGNNKRSQPHPGSSLICLTKQAASRLTSPGAHQGCPAHALRRLAAAGPACSWCWIR